MQHMTKRFTGFLLCFTLLLSSCLGQCTGYVEAAENTDAMRDITSMELVKDMGAGWNLGNSLDACVADRGDGDITQIPEDGVIDETLWGNIMTTPEIFTSLKQQGFHAVRIPVTWRDHLGEAPDYKIDARWMDRVQEVVDYAYNQGMYVIINLHHDGGGDPDYGAWIRNAATDKESVLEKYRAVWQQIADRFQDYSDYLVFESMNEVGFDELEEEDAYAVLNELNQEFVDLIRSSGGNNPKRHLLVAGYWTDIAATSSDYFKMPDDPADRCILSLHYYTPWDFCGTGFQETWGSTEDSEEMQEKIDILKEAYIDQGIPVIIGEYGVGSRTEVESRLRFCGHFVSRCHALGIACFFWDNGEEFNRSQLTWRTEGLAQVLVQACGGQPSGSLETQQPSLPTQTPFVDSPPTVISVPVTNVGDVVNLATGSYKVTGLSGTTARTVSYQKASGTKVKQVTIPATVSINNTTYKVTAVSKKAFKGCTALKKVTIGYNVKKIGANAFDGCKKLKTIRLNMTAFPSLGKKAFNNIGAKPVIYVPSNKKKAYKKKLRIEGSYKKFLALNQTSLTVLQGLADRELDELTVIGTGKKNVRFSSADEQIATVNSNGLVKGITGGSTTITASTAGKKFTCKVTVTPVVPVPMPTFVPTQEPTAAPTDIPPAEWSPMPLYTNQPQEPAEKNEGDVAALKAIIEKYPNSGISSDLDDYWQYTWKNGRLISIDWEEDCNIDGPLEISGLTALERVFCYQCGITELKISDCDSLKVLDCGENNLTSLDLGQADNLFSLTCSYNQLKELDCSDYPALYYLNCSGNKLTSLNLGSLPKLASLDCSSNQLTSLELDGLKSLNYLECFDNPLTELDLSSCEDLVYLDFCQTGISSLDVTACTQLELIYCDSDVVLTGWKYMEKDEEDIAALSALMEQVQAYYQEAGIGDESPKIDSNYLTSPQYFWEDGKLVSISWDNCSLSGKLDVSVLKNLQFFSCSENELEELDISGCSELWYLDCTQNNLTTIDASQNHNLYNIISDENVNIIWGVDTDMPPGWIINY